MTPARSTIASIRFGYGLRPGQTALFLPDEMVREPAAQPGGAALDLGSRAALLLRDREARRAERDGKAGAKAARDRVGRDIRAAHLGDVRRWLIRAVAGDAGFPERLTWFWADHFTVSAGNRSLRLLAPDMIETAIRPHLTGRFADMLKAVVTHPAMLFYLDQVRSVGPGSPAGRRRDRGLNENLAREILELHTLGVGAGYTQGDVRSFARLLTGLSVDKGGFRFRPGIAEPGRHAVLGRHYGGAGTPRLSDIEEALEDLAARPDTATHLARKLIVHFIGGRVSEDSVAAVAEAYLRAGSLADLHAAMLALPEAWTLPLAKVKQPFGYVVSALRALGTGADEIAAADGRTLRRGVLAPMAEMGQTILTPPGPDGWPEAPEAWITAAGLAARIRWANALAETRAPDADPEAFLNAALGDVADDLLRRAVAGAETRAEAVALILASPAFNRC